MKKVKSLSKRIQDYLNIQSKKSDKINRSYPKDKNGWIDNSKYKPRYGSRVLTISEDHDGSFVQKIAGYWPVEGDGRSDWIDSNYTEIKDKDVLYWQPTLKFPIKMLKNPI